MGSIPRPSPPGTFPFWMRLDLNARKGQFGRAPNPEVGMRSALTSPVPRWGGVGCASRSPVARSSAIMGRAKSQAQRSQFPSTPVLSGGTGQVATVRERPEGLAPIPHRKDSGVVPKPEFSLPDGSLRCPTAVRCCHRPIREERGSPTTKGGSPLVQRGIPGKDRRGAVESKGEEAFTLDGGPGRPS